MTDTEKKILSELKKALRIPDDLTDDDSLLMTYILASQQYIQNACDVIIDPTNPTYQFLVGYMAQYFYLNRDNPATKSYPIQILSLLNQLRYTLKADAAHVDSDAISDE